MKKILFILRDGMDADYIYSHMQLDQNLYDVFYIFETGSKARKKKLLRMIKRKRNLFYTFLDLGALYIYDKSETSKMRKKLQIQKPNYENRYIVEDVNDEECVFRVSNINPEIVFVYGTGLLTTQTIKRMNSEIYNIHSSILPFYRNVHSDFHAYMNKDIDKIGVTVLKLTAGIDSGDIALQRTSEMGDGKLYEHKAANLKHIPELVEEFLREYNSNTLHFTPQDEYLSTRSSTPCFDEIARFYKNGA